MNTSRAWRTTYAVPVLIFLLCLLGIPGLSLADQDGGRGDGGEEPLSPISASAQGPAMGPDRDYRYEHPTAEFVRWLESLAAGIPSGPAGDCDTSDCKILSRDDCLWQIPGGCASIDPVTNSAERRLCELGIRIDGDFTDALNLGAVRIVDQVPDVEPNSNSPGPTGEAEEPREVRNPNGINIGGSVILFMPDTDPAAGPAGDNSFLYVAWDVADCANNDGQDCIPNTCGRPPVPYDSDDDHRACAVQDGSTCPQQGCSPPCENLTGETDDDFSEGYRIDIQACANLGDFRPDAVDPNEIATVSNAVIQTGILPLASIPLFLVVEPFEDIQDIQMFPTASPSVGPTDPPEFLDAVNPTNGCIDQEIMFCTSGVALNGDDNNVEMVIKRVESKAYFGPDPLTRRFALAQMVAQLMAFSSGDRGDEESANAALRSSLPDIEVKKQIRCDDTGDLNFRENATALLGSTVGFRIVVRNTGNEDLEVTLTDSMEEVGTQVGTFICEPICGTLAATLTTTNGLIVDIDETNAGDFGLFPEFFFDSCAAPDIGFLGSIRNGESEFLGALDGVSVQRTNGACVLEEGASLVIEYKGFTDTNNPMAFCADIDDPDCQNAVTASGLFEPFPAQSVGGICEFDYQCNDGLFCNGLETCDQQVCVAGSIPCPGQNCDELNDACGLAVEDVADVVDSREELVAGADNNVVTLDLLCRQIEFTKRVGFPGLPFNMFKTGTDALSIPSIPNGMVQDVVFRFEATNTGEITEIVSISDDQLCADLAFVGIDTSGCALCNPGPFTALLAPNESISTNCVVTFTSQDQLRDFIELDDGRVDCTADPNEDAYRNCATAIAIPDQASLGDICDGVAPLEAESFATIQNRPCELMVTKEVRCLPECDPGINPGPWVQDPADLEVTADACVQYRIVVENISDATPPVDICALRFTDDMINAISFASGPDNVQILPPGICGPGLAPPFNWDGIPSICELPNSLGFGETVTILFEGTLQTPGVVDFLADPLNEILVEGVPDGECVFDPLPFSCVDDSSVALDILECGYDVAKDVTCDDPRDPAAVFDPTLVDALPGSTVGFRIQVTNTGEVSLPRVNLTDVLDCPDWFIPNTVVADIDGTDVTACICPGGCTTAADLDGLKDLDTCLAGGVPVNGVLTITFKVVAPDDFATLGTPIDCTNTITVQAETDVCSFSGANPCPEQLDDASINIEVPGIECEEEICADINNDGDCDDAVDTNSFPGSVLALPCDVNDEFPIRLEYSVKVTNAGELPLLNVQACDNKLLQDAADAGLIVGACTLCTDLGGLAPGAMTTATCEFEVPDRDTWVNFAGRDDDNDPDCYTNDVTVTGDVDTTGLCTDGADTDVDSTCGGQVCLAPPCVLDLEAGFQCVDGCSTRNPIGVLTDVLEATPGSTVEFEIMATNAGTATDPSICNIEFTSELIGPYDECVPPPPVCTVEVQNPGVVPCVVPADFVKLDGTPYALDLVSACGVDLDPGDKVVIRCGVEIPDDASGDEKLMLNATAKGSPLCPAGADPVYCCDDFDSAEVDIDTCGFEVKKDVTCDDPRDPGAVFDDNIVEALPGSTVGFRITVCNDGDVTLPRVELTDVLTCDSWYLPGTVVADIDGTDVSDCLCPVGGCLDVADLNGEKDLDSCLPGGIPTNGCLTVTFKVQVPKDFAIIGEPVDCENTIAVEGFTDICSDPLDNACPIDMDTAGINVLVPDIDCETEVCADINDDGDCDDPEDFKSTDFAPSNGLSLPCDMNDAFPFTLEYSVKITNTGETPLVNVQACDPKLLADAAAAGLTIDPGCELCVPVPGPIPPGGMVTFTCRITIPDRASWLDFASRDNDGDPNCYNNTVESSGDVDATGLCDDGDVVDRVEALCGAEVCLSPPCVLEVTKDWRCINGCVAQAPIGPDMNELNALQGSFVEFEIEVLNAGGPDDPDICSLRLQDELKGPFIPCPNACRIEVDRTPGTTVCNLPPDWLPLDGTPVELDLSAACGGDLGLDDRLVIRCAGQIPEDAPLGMVTTNSIMVAGAPDCPPGDDPVYCCDAATNAVITVEECDYSLEKLAVCDDPRTADPGDFTSDVVAFPASTVGFKFEVCNTNSVPLTEIQIMDVLSCASWYQPGSVVADIAGTDVTSCICTVDSCPSIFNLNGLKDLTGCKADGILPGECLTVTFEVIVPPNFSQVGTPVDCVNKVTVEPFSEVCSNPQDNPCGMQMDEARIDVKVPGIDCAKTIALRLLQRYELSMLHPPVC
jgi:uncharacterized repeat protein (TIGR01451 family)